VVREDETLKSLLLIDDEPAVIQGLSTDIDWTLAGIDQVHTASNGIEARTLLEKNRIDVVISDIRMPVMDGLTLARVIHETWPLARLILLTGYNLFDYAQQAIVYHVFRYLTKPTPYELLIETVKDAIKDQDLAIQNIENAVQITENVPLLLQTVLNDIIVHNTDISDDKFQILKDSIPFISDESSMFQILLREKTDKTPVFQWIFNEMKTTIPNLHMVNLPLDFSYHYLLLFFCRDETGAAACLSRIEGLGDMIFTSGESGKDKKGLIIFTPLHTVQDSGSYYQMLLERSQNRHPVEGEHILISSAWDRKVFQTPQYIEAAKEYIEENIAGDCTIAEVSNHVKLNPGYLSGLFKDYVGLNLQQYLISRRVELACSLLDKPGARVQEVAYEVGYSSPYHFSRIFKKMKGISPKEYQKHHF